MCCQLVSRHCYLPIVMTCVSCTFTPVAISSSMVECTLLSPSTMISLLMPFSGQTLRQKTSAGLHSLTGPLAVLFCCLVFSLLSFCLECHNKHNDIYTWLQFGTDSEWQMDCLCHGTTQHMHMNTIRFLFNCLYAAHWCQIPAMFYKEMH